MPTVTHLLVPMRCDCNRARLEGPRLELRVLGKVRRAGWQLRVMESRGRQGLWRAKGSIGQGEPTAPGVRESPRRRGQKAVGVNVTWREELERS